MHLQNCFSDVIQEEKNLIFGTELSSVLATCLWEPSNVSPTSV